MTAVDSVDSIDLYKQRLGHQAKHPDLDDDAGSSASDDSIEVRKQQLEKPSSPRSPRKQQHASSPEPLTVHTQHMASGDVFTGKMVW